MKYLIDFDRTLLDFERLRNTVTHDGKLALVGTVAFWEHYNAMDFLFPDVLPWLATKEPSSIHILSAYKPTLGPEAKAYQEEKLRSGGFLELVGGMTVMEGDKGLAAASIAEQFLPDETIVFIDDWGDQCQSVKSALPQAHCFMMLRYNVCPPEAGDGIIPVSCLAEVDAIMNTPMNPVRSAIKINQL